MWVNVFTNSTTSRYLMLTDDDIESILQIQDEPVYCDDILLADGYELLSANLHSYDEASRWVKNYFPQYTPVHYQFVPISFKEAKEFVNQFHRTHKAPQGCKFCLAVSDGIQTVGVAVIGRPLSRLLDDGKTVELTRMCVKNGFKNVCSFLYGRAARIAGEMGYDKIITYIEETESGKSLKASGWKFEGTVKGHDWNCPGRPRNNNTIICDRQRWSRILNKQRRRKYETNTI